MMQDFRVEHDSLGDVRVPAGALYGAQTQRAVENFPVSGLREHSVFVESYVALKRAAAAVNKALGDLTPERADAIIAAADEVLAGNYREQFVVDVYQAGAGTSFNMNVNEVLANLANLRLGGKPGEYMHVHPNDHVNMAQSTNDSFPTAMRVSILRLLRESLVPSLGGLEAALRAKAGEFARIVTTGRTHLQDATPITLGQVFGAYADTTRKDIERLGRAGGELHYLNIGGTAVGTGINTRKAFAKMMADELSRLTGLALRPARNLVEIAQSTADFAEMSGALRVVAGDIGKLSNDLRLMSSGPTAGIGEIALPAVQPGSSIMPGKVNPSIPEMVNQVCFQVLGQCACVDYAHQAAQFQLNAMMPVMAHAFTDAMTILANALRILAENCVAGIAANGETCRRYYESSPSLVTALSPIIGYSKAAELAKKAVAERRPIMDVIRESGLLTAEQIAHIFRPETLTEPRE